MRTPNEFDRLSTEEELNQVLAVLQDHARNLMEPEAITLWPDTILEDSLEGSCLAEMMERRPTLKN